MKIALLSNINLDPVNRQLKKSSDVDVYEPRGYGNELGVLLNKTSDFYEYNPDVIFVLMDVMELIQHDLDENSYNDRIEEWFGLFEKSIDSGRIYYVSDTYVYGFEMGALWDQTKKTAIENAWISMLKSVMQKHANVRILPYNNIVRKMGEENVFSSKMWYMGKVLHSAPFHKELAKEILHRTNVENRQPKKVLLLDLDNTLWKGLAGEDEITPIELSDSGIGLAYKNFQRSIKLLKQQGVILGIVSKNNEEDAISIIENHPHMVLRMDDFAIQKINWKNKAENIIEVARELNVGMDSMVFVDDNPAEQVIVKENCTGVEVPEFPNRPEELCDFAEALYRDYFEKPVITEEDKEKTKQYQANNERKKLLDNAVNFDDYLDSLEIKLYREDAKANKERFVQLVNKTNQFNLTTKRLTEKEAADILEDDTYEVFLYRVTDRFGDNGIVVAAIVKYDETAAVIEFVMSCRVMGRQIEDAIVEDLESATEKRGYQKLFGIYIPTAKNMPVKDLYPSLGYEKIKEENEAVTYEISLENKPARKIHLKRL